MESNKGEVLKKIDSILLSLLELVAGSNELSAAIKSRLVS